MARAAVSHALSDTSPVPALEALELLEQARVQFVADGRETPSALNFNRGVVLADLGLCRLAGQAFRLSLTAEHDEDWRRETRVRIAALPCIRPRPPGSTLDGRIDIAFDFELPRWAAQVAGTAGAREAEKRLAELGGALEAAGEPLLAKVAKELADGRRLARRGVRRATLAAAAGRTAFLAGEYDRSRRLFDRGSRVLARERCALAGWCRYWRLAIRVYDGDLGAARAGLAALRQETTSPYLRGRAAWSEGLAAHRQGALGAAHDLFRISATELSAAGLTRSHAAVEILRAEVLSSLGAFLEAAQVRRKALLSLQAEEPYFALENGLIDGARDAHSMGFERSANDYFAEAARVAGEKGNVVVKTEIRQLMGELLLRGSGAHSRSEKDSGGARAQFMAARRLALSLPGKQAQERNLANAELGLAESGVPAFRSSAALLDLADYFRRKGPRSGELRALAQLVEVAEGSGDSPQAARIYARADALIREQRNSLSGVTRDAEFLASHRAFFDRMIAISLRQGDAWRALALVADALPGGTAAERPVQPVDPAPGLKASLLPALGNRTLVVYRFLGDELVWWSVRDGRLRYGSLPDARQIHFLIDQLRSARGHPREGQLEEAYRLFLALPILGVPVGEPLILVPDQDLAAVPFAALRRSGSRVRLIERHPLSLAMSPRTVPSVRSSRPERRPPRATIVGDPAFDLAFLPWLGRLDWAKQEAREVAEIYGSGADLLMDREATADAVRKSARGATVLHFAAHALSGSGGEATALVLARDGGGSGLVSGEEIVESDKVADLVVLSACGTLAARDSPGLIGMAGSFLGHGSSAVVGTLWQVEDEEVAGWMVEFHRALANGTTASKALQQVQARAAADGSCCRWAALALVGDVTLPARKSLPGPAASAGD